MTTQITKPLWKALNEQRTQGNVSVTVTGGVIQPFRIHSPEGRIEVAAFNWGIKSYYPETIEEVKANAQYTALCVNNFAAVAEALQKAVDEQVERNEGAKRLADIHNNSDGVGIHFDYVSAPLLPDWVRSAQEALKPIQ